MAAARAGAAAGPGHDAVRVARDRERVVHAGGRRLGDRRDRVGVARGGGHRRLAGRGAPWDADVAEAREVRALTVILLARVASVDERDEVAGVRLRVGVLALALLTEESRECDRREHADYQHDDEYLHEGEPVLLDKAEPEPLSH